MCRGHIAENSLVEVPPDYENQQNDDVNDNDRLWCSSSKVSLWLFVFVFITTHVAAE